MKYLLTRLIALGIFASIIFSGCASGDISVFKVLENGGGDANIEKITEKVKNADIILFGELHNNSMAHWLELRLTKELHKMYGDKLVVGSEMFEADTQIMIDEYFVQGFILPRISKTKQKYGKIIPQIISRYLNLQKQIN